MQTRIFASVKIEKIRCGRLVVSAITAVLAILTYPFLSISSIFIHCCPLEGLVQEREITTSKSIMREK